MQPTRVIIRSPHLCGRFVKAPSAARSMALLSPFGPRFPTHNFPSFTNDFAPLFRLMDDMTLAAPSLEQFFQPRLRQAQIFQPRFDVKEIEGAYELRGELPGVEAKDLEVHFTDAQTLIVRGKTDQETTQGTSPTITTPAESVHTAAKPAELEPTTTNAVVDNSDASSTHSASSYQKPTVEDENAALETALTSGQATPAESTLPEQSSQHQQQQVSPLQAAEPTKQPQYWLSERSTGSFQRTFTFPTRIDQNAVKASLKNGVLHVLVPKAVALQARRIVVE